MNLWECIKLFSTKWKTAILLYLFHNIEWKWLQPEFAMKLLRICSTPCRHTNMLSKRKITFWMFVGFSNNCNIRNRLKSFTFSSICRSKCIHGCNQKNKKRTPFATGIKFWLRLLKNPVELHLFVRKSCFSLLFSLSLLLFIWYRDESWKYFHNFNLRTA